MQVMTRRSTRLQLLITLVLALAALVGLFLEIDILRHLIPPLIGMVVFIVFKICFHRHLPVIGIAAIAFVSILIFDGVFPNIESGENLFMFSLEEFVGIMILTIIDTSIEEVIEYETEHIQNNTEE